MTIINEIQRQRREYVSQHGKLPGTLVISEAATERIIEEYEDVRQTLRAPSALPCIDIKNIEKFELFGMKIVVRELTVI